MIACPIEDIMNETHRKLRVLVEVPVYYKTVGMLESRLRRPPQVSWELWDIILSQLWGDSIIL